MSDFFPGRDMRAHQVKEGGKKTPGIQAHAKALRQAQVFVAQKDLVEWSIESQLERGQRKDWLASMSQMGTILNT